MSSTRSKSERNGTEQQFSQSDLDSLDYSNVFPDFSKEEIHGTHNLNPYKYHNVEDSASCESSTYPTSNSDSTGSSRDFAGRNNIWSLMTKRGYHRGSSPFSDKSKDQDQAFCSEKITTIFTKCLAHCSHVLQTIVKHPYIAIYAVIVFVVFTTVSLVIVEMICQRNMERLVYESRWEALEAGNYFAEQFDKTLIPLRSLQQAVIHSERFKDLPLQIGNYDVNGSAPAIFGPRSTTMKDYRNVSGICDDPVLTKEFGDIVDGITSNFDYGGIIVNYRLAPYGVFCLANPMMNTKDFSVESPMDSTAWIGWDPINSPNAVWQKRLRTVYDDSNDIFVFGPMYDFVQDGAEVFCAHLAVNFPGYNYTIDGKSKGTFGFVMHFIHWSNLKKVIGMDARFNKKKMHYLLTRTDHMVDPETGKTVKHIVTLATNINSPEDMNHTDPSHHISRINDDNSASVAIQSLNGEWIMRVGHSCDLKTDFVYIRIACVVGCLFVTILFALVLIERQLHKLLLYKIMPESAVHKLNMNETVVEHYNLVTIFFSDIVGFTSIAGDMRPIQVMKMLNELYVEFDKVAEKYGVYKVETIGDAYMVVCGAHERIPAPEAAQKVVLFALEVIELVKHLRTTAGDKIYIRTGIASGPVVAGVVGKSMPRYCFFGNTVNLASRMESSSKQMKLQCSDLTYRLLQDAPNFTFDFVEREEYGVKGVALKGKGLAHTWWINGVGGITMSRSERDLRGDIESSPSATSDAVIQSISLSRQNWLRIGLPDNPLVTATSDIDVMIDRVTGMLQHRLSIAMEQRKQNTMTHVQKTQLRSYVSEIASMYNPVDFHNFEHAVHVTTSMHKMVDTIVSSIKNGQLGNGSICRHMWQDSFIHFVMIFACLIHDVEHTGQSNKILQATDHKIAKKFAGPSAEHNSIHISLDLLFRHKYKCIRKAIFPRIQDRFQFGKCIFWAILCTDIATPESVQMCMSRFDVAHTVREGIISAEKKNMTPKRCSYDDKICPVLPYLGQLIKYLRLSQTDVEDNADELIINQDALERCVAVEHLMQICDVAHLMQDWETFLKFNYRLYKELMACHKNGAMPDPSPNWAVGQIGFFTHYVIPLAKRVEKICDRDISSLTLSESAHANMKRWEEEGEVITGIFVSGYENGENERDILKYCVVDDFNC